MVNIIRTFRDADQQMTGSKKYDTPEFSKTSQVPGSKKIFKDT